MKNLFRNFCAFLGMLLGVSACNQAPHLTTGHSEQYRPGQVWRYQTRPGEEESRLIIAKIDQASGKNIVHIQVTGVRIKNPHVEGRIQDYLPHSPISEEALKASVIEMTGEDGQLIGGFDEGYAQWLSAYKSGKGGVFSIPVKEIIDYVEQAMVRAGS